MPNRYLGAKADEKLNVLSQTEDVSRSKMIERLIAAWEKPDVVDLRISPRGFVVSYPYNNGEVAEFADPDTGMRIHAKRVGRTWYLLDMPMHGGADKQFELANEPILGTVKMPGMEEGKDFKVNGKTITMLGCDQK